MAGAICGKSAHHVGAPRVIVCLREWDTRYIPKETELTSSANPNPATPSVWMQGNTSASSAKVLSGRADRLDITANGDVFTLAVDLTKLDCDTSAAGIQDCRTTAAGRCGSRGAGLDPLCMAGSTVHEPVCLYL